MTDLTNRYRSHTKPVHKDKQMQMKVESLALAEVKMYIEDRLQSCEDKVATLTTTLALEQQPTFWHGTAISAMQHIDSVHNGI